MTKRRSAVSLLVTGLLVAVGAGVAQAPAHPDPLEPVRGHVLCCGGGPLPEELFERFVELAGGAEARLVVVPTASQNAEREDAAERYLGPWRGRGVADVKLLHAGSRDEADREEFVAPLAAATGVWLAGGQQSRLARTYGGTRTERAFREVLARGGVVGGTSAGAAVMSRRMIAGGNPEPRFGAGFGLVPGVVIDQHFRERAREPRLRNALATHPGLVGLGIDERTAVLATGRRLRVLGAGGVTVMWAAGGGREASERLVEDGAVLDLPQLRRAALVRAGEAFPPANPAPPRAPAGATLILGGGGRLPDAILERFLEAAGGAEAPIVVVPTAQGRNPAGEPRIVAAMRRLGAREVTVWHVDDRANLRDEAVLAPLRGARGLWFTGGRQWRLVDAYGDTVAEELFRDVLRRGGVIGGSSAGTSIQAEYMVRGHPLGNRVMMAEGYEQGFGFLPGVAVDQHFKQRNREPDLRSVVERYPQIVGLGIDESTAIVVRDAVFEVLGRHGVTVLDARGDSDGETRRTVVPAGQRFDLIRGELVRGDLVR